MLIKLLAIYIMRNFVICTLVAEHLVASRVVLKSTELVSYLHLMYARCVIDVLELHTPITFRIEMYGGKVLFPINERAEQN
jgi:hypothetical protein